MQLQNAIMPYPLLLTSPVNLLSGSNKPSLIQRADEVLIKLFSKIEYSFYIL